MKFKRSRGYIIKLLLYMTIITVAFMSIAYFGVNNVFESSQREAEIKMEFETHSELNTIANFITIRFSKIVDMMQSLSGNYEILSAFNDQAFKSMTVEHFKNIITYSDDYLQLRLISLDGQELVRVDNIGGRPVVVPDSALQDKSDRYYFQEMVDLKNNQLYFSPFDLNIENGEIEKPFVPTYRVGKALYKDNQKIGYLIINYSGSDILKIFEYHFHYTNHGNIYLINSEGHYYINEDNPESTWGFMFEDDQKLSDDFPEAWHDISTIGSDHFYNDPHGFFSCHNFNPLLFNIKGDLEIVLSERANYKWILVHHLPQESLDHLSNFTDSEKRNMLITLFILSFIVSLFVSERILENRANKSHLVKQATTDPLTGILNRAAGLESLQQMTENYALKDSHLVFLDLDFLKKVNDSLGHEQGDNYIVAFAECINSQIRDHDLFFRYAGDEFILCFSDSNTITVERIMIRIQDQFLRENPIILDDANLGFSYGIVEFNPDKHPLVEHWIAEADNKMYRHKSNKKTKSTQG